MRNLLICHVNCFYMSVTNTKAYATLVTEHIYFGYVIVIFLFSFLFDKLLVNIVNVINFVHRAQQ